MDTDNDWRLTNQDRYLQGAALRFGRYQRPRPDWDHDHCEFCWVKFMEEDFPDVLHEGYVTDDGRWICPDCFEDFKLRFAWILKEGSQ